MKCLSVRQPHAAMIALGYKPIEIRSWKTDYRGPLAIASSRACDPDEFLEFIEEYNIPLKLCTLGSILCIVDFYNLRHTRDGDQNKAFCNVYDDEYAWLFRSPKIVTPQPTTGKLRLFDVEIQSQQQSK